MSFLKMNAAVSVAIGDVVKMKPKYLSKFNPRPDRFVVSDLCVWPELNEVLYAISGVPWFRFKAFVLMSRADHLSLDYALSFASLGPLESEDEVIDLDPDHNMKLDLRFHTTQEEDLEDFS